MAVKPNVLLIMTDQHRFDACGFMGNSAIETPSLDFLASCGTVFRSAYSPSPSCIPARACLMTGQNPWSTGVLFTGNSAGPHLPGGVMGVNFTHTLAGELSKNGWQTAGIGKMHFFPQRATLGFACTVLDESGREEDPRFTSDYKEWFLSHTNTHFDYDITDHGIHWNSWMARPWNMDESLHPTNWTANTALDFLQKRDPSKPFFLKMSFARPHSPYDAPEYYFNQYDKKKLPPPVEGEWSRTYADKKEKHSIVGWCGKQSDERSHRAKAGYYGSITHIDSQIARVIMNLIKTKQFDNTLIIFTSDHGDMLGDHNLWRKTYAYEGSAHIPFVVKPPKSTEQNPSAASTCAVTLCDIMPTVLETCGVPIPQTVEGLSLLPAIRGKSLDRTWVHGEHTQTFEPEQENHFVTDGKRKYVWFTKTGAQQFFDLEADPYETQDVSNSAKYAEELATFRKELVCELENRDQGDFVMAKNGKLLPVSRQKLIVSPHYLERLSTSDYKWIDIGGKNERPS